MRLCVFSLLISHAMIERMYTLSYYHHQIGSFYPLFRIRSWNNGMRCMSLYILITVMTYLPCNSGYSYTWKYGNHTEAGSQCLQRLVLFLANFLTFEESEYIFDDWEFIHQGWVTHIFVSKEAIIGSDNNLSPNRRQIIIWTSAGVFLVGRLGTHFSKILFKIQQFPSKRHLKMTPVKFLAVSLSRPQCVKPFPATDP